MDGYYNENSTGIMTFHQSVGYDLLPIMHVVAGSANKLNNHTQVVIQASTHATDMYSHNRQSLINLVSQPLPNHRERV